MKFFVRPHFAGRIPLAIAVTLASCAGIFLTNANSKDAPLELPSSEEEARLETVLSENTPLVGFTESRAVDVTGCTITIITEYDRKDCGSTVKKQTNIYGLRELAEEGPRYGELPKRSQPKFVYSPPPSFRPSSNTHSLTWNVSSPVWRIMKDAQAEIDKLLGDEKFFTTEWDDRKPKLTEADRYAYSVLDENGIVTRSMTEDCDGFVSYDTTWADTLYLQSSHEGVMEMGKALAGYRNKYCEPEGQVGSWWWPW
jgi:hypothetical protein